MITGLLGPCHKNKTMKEKNPRTNLLYTVEYTYIIYKYIYIYIYIYMHIFIYNIINIYIYIIYII